MALCGCCLNYDENENIIEVRRSDPIKVESANHSNLEQSFVNNESKYEIDVSENALSMFIEEIKNKKYVNILDKDEITIEINSEGSKMCVENPIIHTQFLIKKNLLKKQLNLQEIQSIY